MYNRGNYYINNYCIPKESLIIMCKNKPILYKLYLIQIKVLMYMKVFIMGMNNKFSTAFSIKTLL